MTQADSVLSTPPTNTSANNPPGPVDPTRRRLLTVAAIASVAGGASLAIAAAAPGIPAAVAMPNSTTAQAGPDPIFAALEAFRSADAEFYADTSGDIPDAIGDRWSQAVDDVIRTRPTTPAGLGALTSFARDMWERSNRGDAGFGDRQWVPVAAAIDDATRGMSGLEPWSPPTVVSTPLGQHPDAKLFAATDRYLAGLSEYAASVRAFGEIEFIEPRPRGYILKERAYLRTMKHFGKMERELVNIRPKTLDGLFAKARALEADRYVSDNLRESVLEDVFGMQPGRGKAVRS